MSLDNLPRIDKKDIYCILLIVLIALIPRVIYFFEYHSTGIYPVLSLTDSESYLNWARDIAGGRLLGDKVFMKWPFYAYFLALFVKVSSFPVLSAYLLQFVLGILNCVLVFIIGSRLLNRFSGFVAALLCAWYGLFIFYEGLLVYTSLSIFLNSFFLLFLLYAKERLSSKNLFLSGLLLGLCTLTQANILVFGAAAVLFLITKKYSGRRFLYGLFSFVFGLGIIMGACAAANYLAEKDTVLLSGSLGLNFYLGNNENATGTYYCPEEITPNQEAMFRDSRIIAEAAQGKRLKSSEVSNYWFGRALMFIKADPRFFVRLTLKKIALLFSPHEFVYDAEYHFIADKIKIFRVLFMDLRFILPLGIIGAVFGLRRLKERFFLYLVLFTLAFGTAFFYVTARYRLVLVPYIMLFAGSGIFYIWQAVKARKFIRLMVISAVFCIFFFGLHNLGSKKPAQGLVEQTQKRFYEHYYKALFYENNLDYKGALKEFNAAYDIDPLRQRIAYCIAMMHNNLGDFDSAAKKFAEALSANPLNVDAYVYLGIIYANQGRLKEAGELLEKAIQLDENDIRARFALASIYRLTAKNRQAKEQLEILRNKISPWRTAEIHFIRQELDSLK